MTSRLTVKNEDAPIKTIRNAPSNTQNNAPNDSLLFGDYLQKWVEIVQRFFGDSFAHFVCIFGIPT